MTNLCEFSKHPKRGFGAGWALRLRSFEVKVEHEMPWK